MAKTGDDVRRSEASVFDSIMRAAERIAAQPWREAERGRIAMMQAFEAAAAARVRAEIIADHDPGDEDRSER